MKDQIAYCCKKLRLGRKIVDVFEEVEADNNQEYLMKILRIALDNRETSRKNRLVKQAGFYALKTFEDFSFEEIRLPQDLSPEELKKASFVDEKKNLILYGNVGTGKTHLAQAIGLEACKQNKVVRFFRTAALVNRLSEAQKKSELNAFMKTLMKADLIICDEWGYVPLDRDGSKLLFQVVSECYEQRSVIITTNLEFSKWVHIFYDEQMTAAMIDRLVHHSHLLLFEGQSFRIRNSLMKTH
ncbi:ATP-binding protein [Mesotoga sp. Brook.08.YT.4.2.5.1]|uniref:IS21-like element helper ATPase IstB n=1 Tax=unclassified Mesotoga TaxID=1184398 RepID=UPI000C9A5230|nr:MULTISPECIES: IS21-like element helper ATPase IstB [unclassified Mesotoga]PNE20138.1 ATP-binding protein [Mesotoga sp. Brook.08.YT.4.2.5.1]RAM64559.1 ATP-binding protein [Mesotoga sp. SC_3PWM13N19]RAO96973.1 ATP-binding protein [Mesotoga sp. Brook.08.YT.4.2.5.4.]